VALAMKCFFSGEVYVGYLFSVLSLHFVASVFQFWQCLNLTFSLEDVSQANSILVIFVFVCPAA